MKQFVVVSYDISDDKRRRKVMQAMEDYGTRVQYSVFECNLQGTQIAKLKRRLQPYVRPPSDSVRFYYISADDLTRIEVLGGGSVTGEQAFFLH
jgi:CRISPR-associated protein Cas2